MIAGAFNLYPISELVGTAFFVGDRETAVHCDCFLVLLLEYKGK